MLEEIKNIKTGKKDLRNFGITLGIIFLIISGFLLYKEKESFQLFIYVASLFIGLGLIFPIVLKPIYLVWMIFSVILGWFMTRLVLSLLFYFVITPISLVFRLSGKQFIDLSWNKRISTYWNYKKQTDLLNGHYEKQF